jgi:hypothetical protein
MGLLLGAGKLVVGWSWQEFLSSLFGLVVHGSQTTDLNRLWLRAGINTAIAVVVVLLGGAIEKRRLQSSEDRQERSTDSGEDDDNKVKDAGKGSLTQKLLGN